MPQIDPALAAETSRRVHVLIQGWLTHQRDTTAPHNDGAPVAADITVDVGTDRLPDAAGFLQPEDGKFDVTVASDWLQTVGSWCDELPTHLVLEVARRDIAQRPVLVFAARVIDYLGTPRIVSSPAIVSWQLGRAVDLTWCNDDPELYDEPHIPAG